MGKVTIIIESKTQTTQDVYDLAKAMIEGAEIPEEVEVYVVPSDEE